MKLLITGASGYIGQRLVRLAKARGHTVIGAGRRASAGADAWCAFDLAQPGALTLAPEIDAVIHLAAVTDANGDPDGGQQLAAAAALLAAARQIDARFLFVSSQTARQDAPTSYGRNKWQIEQLVLAAGGAVVRPGQVYGAQPHGLFGVLLALVKRLPCVPSFLPAPHIQPIHVDDLAAGMLAILARSPSPARIFQLAAPRPVPFTAFLSAIAAHRLRRRRLPLPLPVLGVQLAGAVLGERRKRGLGLDRLDSLFGLLPMASAADVAQLDLVLRPLHAGMHPSGDDTRRRLLQEGMALLTYLLAARPAPTLARRYARMIEQVRGGRPLQLPALARRLPASLALWDRRGGAAAPGLELAWRLHAATALAEASVQGAGRFLGLGRRSGVVAGIAGIAAAVGGEVLWRLLAAVLAVPLRRALLAMEAGHAP